MTKKELDYKFIIRQVLLLIVVFFQNGCKSDSKNVKDLEAFMGDKNIQVIIQHAQSYKVDVMNGIYSVFFISKPTLEVKFELSIEEKRQIVEKFYSLDLPNLLPEKEEVLHIEDECFIMPKIYTYLSVKGDSLTRQIEIDTSCDDFSQFNADKANRIKSFLDYVSKIIYEKPQVKNAPESDIFYL
ncbi:hypothetical protein GCM10027036_07770 [Flavihumibacter cheonanensis]|uniref:hypothetical protein n=1 Tax=Flavihumibacter cheonanensis TaxID=1442385 RepID=UPI001EF9AE54|nr:hypothetical protein [Flavihumibacter cheonanensis]MCG7751779.1 hypothetical protein [Flavihumibacter cheonanensis]